MEHCLLFPTPRQITYSGEFLVRPEKCSLAICREILTKWEERGCILQKKLSGLFNGTGPRMDVTVHLENMSPQTYRLTVERRGITIACGDDAGAYYAVSTLIQILEQCGGEVPCLTVEDGPVLRFRGVLLDVGRDKIPTLATMFDIIEKLSAMRYNHVELYIEGYAFAWPEYAYLFPDETPLTQGELRMLDRFARSRYVELVPSVNILGHMEKWLEKPQFRPLAECEDGYLFQGLYRRPPMTLDVRDERSTELVADLLNQLCACFESDKVNVNLDEPFELGMGKNAAFAAEKGKERLYMDYLHKVHGILENKGKRMLMWGDVLFSHPDCMGELPEDVLLLDWLYEGAGDFAHHARILAESGRKFCLCPGTSAWCSFTGRSDNMLRNIRNAAECALSHGAEGILLTDWGDLGHWQYLSTSYPAFAWGAQCAWVGDTAREEQTAAWCNRTIYRDPAGEAWQLAVDMGNYYRLERAPLYSTTLCFAVLCSKYRFSSPEEFDEMLQLMVELSANLARGMELPVGETAIGLDGREMNDYLDNLEHRVGALELGGEEGALIREEMRQSLRMVRHGLGLYLAMTGLRENPCALRRELRLLSGELDGLLRRHHRLWMARNRQGGYSRSARQLEHLLHIYRTIGREEPEHVPK